MSNSCEITIAPNEESKFRVRIISKMQHGVLSDAVEKVGSIKALAELIGVSAYTIRSWLNLKVFPTFKKWPEARRTKVVTKLCEIVGKRITDIFPEYARELLKDTPRTVIQERTFDPVAAHQYIEETRNRLTLPSPYEALEAKDRRKVLLESLKTLNHREQQILKLRYGLIDGKEHTYTELTHTFKVTKERIRQLQMKAERKLRDVASLQPFAKVEGSK